MTCEQPDPADVPDTTTPDAYGVHVDWVDALDEPQRISPATRDLLHEVIGEPPADLEDRAPVVVRPGRPLGLGAGPHRVTCEDGSVREVGEVLDEDFPLGYHELDVDGRTRRLIVSPGRCWLPDGARSWGLTVQLYAARSRGSWGVGDLAGLRLLRTWAEEQGAGFLLVNPLHAVAPGHPQEPSPYLPATRRFRNLLYVAVPEAPGADLLDPAVTADLVARGAALNEAALVDRDAAWTLKDEALRLVHATGSRADEHAAWRAEQGAPLEGYATWAALALAHGPDWREWPEELRRSDASAVTAYAEEHADEVAYQAWLQWVLDLQLREATGGLTVLQDLPIGVDGGGADAWAWGGELARGVTVGAPPDRFNPAGQDWGSPPFIPWRLRLGGYDAFIASIRATMAGAGGLRIDHVMGLFRLWWVPPGGPGEGAYVRYPSGDMLDIVALESHRAQAVVVGEDLGTVEPGVREELADRNVLSYRLLWFEDDHPREWPTSAMAAVTTHDLPTVAGLWTGVDAEEQAAHAGGEADAERLARDRDTLLEQVLSRTDLTPGSSVSEALVAAHALLAEAPSLLVSATLEDLVADERRPNVPGTTDRANWCLPAPVRLDELPDHPVAAAVVATLRAAVPPRPPA